MHNFDDLQKRCKIYTIKKNLKYLLILILFLVLILYAYNLTDVKASKKNNENKTITGSHLIKKPAVKKEAKKTTITKEKKHPVVIKESKKLETKAKKYSLQFLVASPRYINRIKKEKKYLETLGFSNCRLQQSAVYIHLTCNESDTLQDLDPYIELAQRKKLDYVIRTQNNDALQQGTVPKKKEKVKKSVPPVQIQKTPQQTALPMIKVQNADTQELQKRFAQTPNYAVALVIARNYYEEGNYKKAIVWAKKANQLNKSDAGSWIIYAKSLYALHQDAKAKQLLHIYLQYENSDAAQSLLKQWEHTQ
ncbi:tetratricopeptide repeat protein [Sulfurimonas sediminis]|uniref:Tetratricopeptide repeat protein n=1 Tax=Sulfurimonas sediminis TaxID=2590020 RepID=A0A7M1B2L3_9BACT|nr:CDC27 family protein [Sulfurimonas sediminis]QOP42902.1 tetratricopeptide repeat protein [Sulfurimonas sediminis]